MKKIKPKVIHSEVADLLQKYYNKQITKSEKYFLGEYLESLGGDSFVEYYANKLLFNAYGIYREFCKIRIYVSVEWHIGAYNIDIYRDSKEIKIKSKQNIIDTITDFVNREYQSISNDIKNAKVGISKVGDFEYIVEMIDNKKHFYKKQK